MKPQSEKQKNEKRTAESERRLSDFALASRFSFFAFVFFVWLPAAWAATLPSTLGWFSIPNTAYNTVCPPASQYPAIQGNSGCAGVADDWAGGIADTKNNRLIFTGGGHHDYYGNEVYALDLNSLTINRLDAPSDVSGINTNTTAYEAYADGRPGARHTYGGLAYIPTSNLMYMYGGGIPSPGDLSNATWTLDLNSVPTSCAPNCTPVWQRKDPTTGGPPNTQFGELAEYDPNTDSVFLWDSWQSQSSRFWQYTVSTNTYKLLTSDNGGAFMNGYQSGVIDPVGKMFYAIGQGGSGGVPTFLRRSIAPGSNYAETDLTATASGCSALYAGHAYPGLAYDPVQNAIVEWTGGNSVVVYSIANNNCNTVTPAGSGPTTTGQNGTYGRFRYFPALNVFAVCNNWQENCFALRLTNGTPPPPPPPPSTSLCDVNGDGTTNVADVQTEVNMALGISTCSNASGTCTVVSVQRVVNAALGGTCVSP